MIGMHGGLSRAEHRRPAGRAPHVEPCPGRMARCALWPSSSSSPGPWTAASRPWRCRWTTTTASAAGSGLIFTRLDRAGASTLSSRLGLSTAAIEVTDDLDFWDVVADERMRGGRVDYLICDEAQFYSPAQAEQLARVVDELGVDVFAFGITADFRTRLFPGSQRLIELADRVQVLQVEALCWCGARATHNARTVNGVMVVEGEQVVVGDTDAGDDASATRCSAAATTCAG